MHEQVAEAIYLAKGTFKHKWLAIALAWLICIAGWFYIMSMPNLYISESRVHVDSRTMLRPLLRGLTVQSDVRALVHIMKELMFTNKNLEKIAHLAKMEAIDKGEMERLNLLANLKEYIKIDGGKNDLFTISYLSPNPKQAKDVVLAVLSVFSEQTQMKTMGDIGSAQRFLNEQIQEYEKRLVSAEQARENFKRVNFGLLPSSEIDQMAQLSALTVKIDEAQLILNEANSRKNVLQMQLEEALDTDEEWAISNLSVEVGAEDAKIAELKSNRTDLLLRYTENHPSILAIDSIMALLEQRKEEEEKNDDSESSIDSMAMVNPYVQSLKVAVNDARAEVAAVQSRVDSLESRLDKRKNQLDSRLKIETAMQNLNRDYKTVKDNYMKLLERREKAAMSGKLDIEANALKFKVSDPPNLPIKPDSPNRLILAPVVLAVGLIVGFGIAFLLYFIKPVYMSTRQVRSATGLPVLGTVSMQTLESDEGIAASMYPFLIATIALLAIFLLIMIIEILAATNDTIYGYVQNIYWQLNALKGD
jgi:polysaccharide chain length determinant protein (PEP-CTERM system associated)